MMAANEKVDARSIRMERVFAASAQDLWSALTDPARVALWYGGDGFANPHCEMDVQVGGIWSHVMRTPDGTEHSLRFRFTRVEPPHILAWRDAADSSGPLNLVRLEEAPGGTLLRFEALFPSSGDREAAEEFGFAFILEQGFARMAGVLGEQENVR